MTLLLKIIQVTLCGIYVGILIAMPLDLCEPRTSTNSLAGRTLCRRPAERNV
jgi:ABC-type phosphate/phosphonate transport system permease subunit